MCKAGERGGRAGTGTGGGVNVSRLTFEDDPVGGIVSTVEGELFAGYALDTIPFTHGDVVLDIGAHVGVVSCYLGSEYPGLRIIAFEPQPECFARLKRNLATNGVKNVLAVNKAVTGDGREVRIYGNLKANSGGTSLFLGEPDDPGTAAQSTTLAQIYRDYGIERVKLLKLDAEGAEYEIIGNGDALARVDYLSGEFHINKRLERLKYSSQSLLALCSKYIAREHLHVALIRMAD